MISRYNLRLIVKRSKARPIALLFYDIDYLKREGTFDFPQYDYLFPQNLVEKRISRITRRMHDYGKLFILQDKKCRYKE